MTNFSNLTWKHALPVIVYSIVVMFLLYLIALWLIGL